jgi:cytochrome c oxidase cbb3-type subunit 4
MKSQVLSQFNLTFFPIAGFLIFFLIFVGMLIWIYRKDAKRVYQEAQLLPFNDGVNKYE